MNGETPAKTLVVFQSPSGVLGVCRGVFEALAKALELVVSVPFRGFRGLQAEEVRTGCLGDVQVSVPFRGFRGLQEPSASFGSNF